MYVCWRKRVAALQLYRGMHVTCEVGEQQPCLTFLRAFCIQLYVWTSQQGRQSLVMLKVTLRLLSFSTAGHLPIHPDASDRVCLAWNYEDALSVIHSHQCVVCFLAGHLHDGGYCLDSHGVHHLTLEGVIETPPESNAFGTIYVYEDKMILKGRGRISDRVMHFWKW